MKTGCTVRKNALKCLHLNWGKAIAILGFTFGISVCFLLLEQLFFSLLRLSQKGDALFAIDLFGSRVTVSDSFAFLTILFGIFAFLILTPLRYGVRKWYFHQAGGEQPSILTIFYCFKSARAVFRCWVLSLWLGLCRLFWGLLASLPVLGIGAGIAFLSRLSSPHAPVWAALLTVLNGLTAVLMAVFWSMMTLRYFLADYLLVSEEGMTPVKAIRYSVQMMKRFKLQIFLFCLSFLPLFLLCVLVFPLLFILPYYFLARALYAKVLIESGREAIFDTRRVGPCPSPGRCAGSQKEQSLEEDRC